MNSIAAMVLTVLLIESSLLVGTVRGGCRASRGNYCTFRRGLFVILPRKGVKSDDVVRYAR